MTDSRRSLHLMLITTGVFALFLGLLVCLSVPPASAATATFDQTHGAFAGDDYLEFPNLTPINLPAASGATQGPGGPYPSEVSVPYDAHILDVDVRVRLSHEAPDDLDLLLVGPHGQQTLLMADSGSSYDVSHIELTFDDEASNPLPDGGPLGGGTYRPANHLGPDEFPAPAPALNGSTTLGDFDGSSAAGTWRLFALDDAGLDTGAIDAWTLVLALRPAPYPSSLNVGGLPPVTDVDVVLHGLTSTYPRDVDALLVGPGGQQATVMSDVSDHTNVSNVELRLDDDATDPLPPSGELSSGTYRPANYDEALDPYGPAAPQSTGNTALSAFDGIDPNGEWRLFFLDDSGGDANTITGWSLHFTFSDTQSPSGSVSIAGGAATTSSQTVSLNLSATDPAPSNGVTAMRFSNDGSSFSTYQPYAPSAAWQLAPGDGTKTVFAQFRDADGNESAVVQDTITLASAAAPSTDPSTNPSTDTTGPRATKLSPAAGSKAVKTSATALVKATEALRAGSITGKTVFLQAKGSSRHVRAKLAYRASSRTIVLTPRSKLQHHTTYRVVVKGVRDLAGNGWDQKPAKAGAQPLSYAFVTL